MYEQDGAEYFSGCGTDFVGSMQVPCNEALAQIYCHHSVKLFSNCSQQLFNMSNQRKLETIETRRNIGLQKDNKQKWVEAVSSNGNNAGFMYSFLSCLISNVCLLNNNVIESVLYSAVNFTYGPYLSNHVLKRSFCTVINKVVETKCDHLRTI